MASMSPSTGRTATMNRRSTIWRGTLPVEASSGVALLEVIFALTLFVTSAAVILSGVSSSINAIIRMQAEAQGADLTVTVLSEIQMGLIEPKDDGPNEFDPPVDDWTWEIVTSELQDIIEGPEMTRIEIVIASESLRHTSRLTYLLPSRDEESEDSTSTDDGGAGGVTP